MQVLGVTGTAGSGKTTLIDALGAGRVSREAGRARTVWSLPDPYLHPLAAAEGSRKITPLQFELREVPLTDTASLRECSALILVTRAEEPPAAVTEIDSVVEELALADSMLVEGALQRLKKVAASGDPAARAALGPAQELLESIETGDSARFVAAAAHPHMPKEWALLLRLPVLGVVNVSEESVSAAEELEARLSAAVRPPLRGVIASCLQVERELAELPERDAKELRDSYGIRVPMQERLASRIVEALDLVIFYTANEKEARAWAVPRGTPISKAAGKVHSDMERGFIRAEVVPAETLLEAGSLKEARSRGTVRLEGRDYPVANRDVVWVRFNV